MPLIEHVHHPWPLVAQATLLIPLTLLLHLEGPPLHDSRTPPAIISHMFHKTIPAIHHRHPQGLPGVCPPDPLLPTIRCRHRVPLGLLLLQGLLEWVVLYRLTM